MDPEITSLAQGGGATLVTLMATDAWQAAREGFVQLWRRMQPNRAEAISAELDAGHAEVAAAVVVDDQGVLSEVRAEWQGRLRRLLVGRPEAVAELRRLLDEIAPLALAGVPAVTQRAIASGHARIYQAGRDQHITEQ
ncbi:hypothetical protein GA0115240_142182 [Streptomyces sp. DvalAA-14]|uniref:hypothetical protein n=1 Tax=unclassified Streptomyces TaxID=2593676 RepID=UPI00081B6E08|nr:MULTISPECIES: hypothetical protein [unclassified Streptomyces]MYS22519.1 hypothetical protein [Streptomyces sp. SID4948]SCE17631.1 hypothetical protein GA0115240_142182 [Streptomyces sp. DvalAA-14]